MEQKLVVAYSVFGAAAIILASCFITISDSANTSEKTNTNVVTENIVSEVNLTATGTNSTEYEVSSYSGDNELFGDGDTWEVKNVSSDDNVFFVFADGSAVTSPKENKVQYSYNDTTLTTYRNENVAILFAANGIYSTPEVVEIWVINSVNSTLIWNKI